MRNDNQVQTIVNMAQKIVYYEIFMAQLATAIETNKPLEAGFYLGCDAIQEAEFNRLIDAIQELQSNNN
jgi:hypothetical protein